MALASSDGGQGDQRDERTGRALVEAQRCGDLEAVAEFVRFHHPRLLVQAERRPAPDRLPRDHPGAHRGSRDGDRNDRNDRNVDGPIAMTGPAWPAVLVPDAMLTPPAHAVA